MLNNLLLASLTMEMTKAVMTLLSQLQVREALGSKVSRERIGTELQGMIDGKAFCC